MKVLVTGANGFVGRALCKRLSGITTQVVPCVRSKSGFSDEMVVGSIDGSTHWARAVKNCHVVVHLAARVHVMDDRAEDSLAAYRSVNVDGTLNLARQAAAAGVRRFVFISSIKVNGEATLSGEPFHPDAAPAPKDPYGISKMEAEQALRTLAVHTGMEVVIIRPPLVYGLGVQANFLALMRWLDRGLPLPLGGITQNRRSLVALDNLVDLIATCIDHPQAANQIFLVSDGLDLSTADLLCRLARALGRPARFTPVPLALLRLGAAVVGKKEWMQRLCGNLQVDIGKTEQLLGWRPPVSIEEGLEKTVEGIRL